MHAPESHPALDYLRRGWSVIPLAPNAKGPHPSLGNWRDYQNQRADERAVMTWEAWSPMPNWGVVCGQVSGGIYCGDVDDKEFADWVLEHAGEPVFRGACIVVSGSGKAHIWFRSNTPVTSAGWKPPRGPKVGDIRGEGQPGRGPSYMMMPPSIHPDTGEPYRLLPGSSFDRLPEIDNGYEFLASILATYQGQTHRVMIEPPSTNKSILALSDDDKAPIFSHVKRLGLKPKIEHVLLRQGNYSPTHRDWARSGDPSHSGIDWQVICELVRKGQTFDQIEQIFAACYVGGPDGCYGNKHRSNHGYGYLKSTYDNALRDVKLKEQQARLAKGDNFEVLDVRRTVYSTDESIYQLRVSCTRADGSVVEHNVTLRDVDLETLDKTKVAFQRQVLFVPTFTTSQQGRHFAETFAQAVYDMVSETTMASGAESRFGVLALATRRILRSFPQHVPEEEKLADGRGWCVGSTYHLRILRLIQMWRSGDHTFNPNDTRRVMDLLGTWNVYLKDWPDAPSEQVIELDLQP